jgi:hypothetical protein
MVQDRDEPSHLGSPIECGKKLESGRSWINLPYR